MPATIAAAVAPPLPPYPQLDQVLAAYVEDDRTLEDLPRRLRRLEPITG